MRLLPPSSALLAALLCVPASAAPERTKLMFLGLTAGPGVASSEARNVSEALQSEVSGTGLYAIYGKSEIQALINVERQKQLMGCADDSSECLAEVAGAMNSERAISGDLARSGPQMLLNVSMTNPSSGKVLGRVSRTVVAPDSIGPILDELQAVAYELANHDPLAKDRKLEPVRQFGGLLIGVRGDADLFSGGALAAAPGLSAELSNKRFGAAASVIIKPNPGVRLEGRYFPLQLAIVRPYLGAGATAFPSGLGVRGALGADVSLGRFHVFGDFAYERYVVELGTEQNFLANAALVSLGIGWLL